jgi:hypothetical protein
MKIIIIILNLVLIGCAPINHSFNIPNVENQVLQSTFTMYVDSVSLDLPHNKEYFNIYDLNHPNARKNNKEISASSNNYPYYQELTRYVEESLNSIGYKNRNEAKLSTESLVPIYTSFSYRLSDNTNTLLMVLQSKNFILKHNKKHELLTYRQLVDEYLKYKSLKTSPLWTITLRVEGHNSINNNFTLISMIKCATPYLNTNFNGIVNCTR